jgi:hypothetical protein
MATFTMPLYEVIETLYGTSSDENEYEQVYESVTYGDITYGKLPVLPQYESINLAYYPIFAEGYRKILNGKIIDEYYNQEIGTETIENFLLILRKKMDQVMPYFNELYLSTQLDFDPLKTMDIQSVGTNTTEGTESATAINETNSTTSSGSRATNLTFPQTALAGNADYATSAVDSNSNSGVEGSSQQENESTTNSESNSDSHVTGYQGIPANLVMAYRNTLINIDMMILDEIKDCFMMLNNNGDEYFATESRYGWY